MLDNDFDGAQLHGMILVLLYNTSSSCKYYIRHGVYYMAPIIFIKAIFLLGKCIVRSIWFSPLNSMALTGFEENETYSW
jgi:hypothetical protein